MKSSTFSKLLTKSDPIKYILSLVKVIWKSFKLQLQALYYCNFSHQNLTSSLSVSVYQQDVHPGPTRPNQQWGFNNERLKNQISRNFCSGRILFWNRNTRKSNHLVTACSGSRRFFFWVRRDPFQRLVDWGMILVLGLMMTDNKDKNRKIGEMCWGIYFLNTETEFWQPKTYLFAIFLMLHMYTHTPKLRSFF